MTTPPTGPPATPQPTTLLPAVSESADLAAVNGLVARSAAIREAATEPAELTQLLAELDIFVAMFRRAPAAVGLAAMEAEKRRAEIRLGELTPQLGRTRARGHGVPPKVESDARKLARNKPIVEEVIAASTDASPPSRRKILKAIDEAEGKVAAVIVAVDLLRPDVVGYLDALAAHHGVSRGAILVKLLELRKPPDTVSPTGFAARQAHAAAFPKPTPTQPPGSGYRRKPTPL